MRRSAIGFGVRGTARPRPAASERCLRADYRLDVPAEQPGPVGAWKRPHGKRRVEAPSAHDRLHHARTHGAVGAAVGAGDGSVGVGHLSCPSMIRSLHAGPPQGARRMARPSHEVSVNAAWAPGPSSRRDQAESADRPRPTPAGRPCGPPHRNPGPSARRSQGRPVTARIHAATIILTVRKRSTSVACPVSRTRSFLTPHASLSSRTGPAGQRRSFSP